MATNRQRAAAIIANRIISEIEINPEIDAHEIREALGEETKFHDSTVEAVVEAANHLLSGIISKLDKTAKVQRYLDPTLVSAHSSRYDKLNDGWNRPSASKRRVLFKEI